MSYGAANYGRNVLMRPSAHYHGGMAMPDVNPRGGVFGPQGYGGGIFAGVGETQNGGGVPWKWVVGVALLGGIAYFVFSAPKEPEDGPEWEVRLHPKKGRTRYKSFRDERKAHNYFEQMMLSGDFRDGDVSQVGN